MSTLGHHGSPGPRSNERKQRDWQRVVRGAGHRVQSLQTEQLTDQGLLHWGLPVVSGRALCYVPCVIEAPTVSRFQEQFHPCWKFLLEGGKTGV